MKMAVMGVEGNGRGKGVCGGGEVEGIGYIRGGGVVHKLGGLTYREEKNTINLQTKAGALTCKVRRASGFKG